VDNDGEGSPKRPILESSPASRLQQAPVAAAPEKQALPDLAAASPEEDDKSKKKVAPGKQSKKTDKSIEEPPTEEPNKATVKARMNAFFRRVVHY
jgi:hypothetical protein